MFWNKAEYKVEPTGRAGVIYSEGKRSLTIFSEMLVGGDFDVVVYLSRNDNWDRPHQTQGLTADDRERIKSRIGTALKTRIEWA